MLTSKNHNSWSSYSEWLGYYFAANDVQDEDSKKTILLTVCGPLTFQLVKSLFQPGTPADKSYSKLVEVLGKHFNLAQSVIMQRLTFNTQSRKESESVPTYVADLKRLGEHCEFGENFNEMVRDWLVCGVNDFRIQNRLLQESSLQRRSKSLSPLKQLLKMLQTFKTHSSFFNISTTFAE